MMGEPIGYFRGEGGALLRLALPLPPIMAKQERKGTLRRVNPDGSQYREPEPEPSQEGQEHQEGQEGSDGAEEGSPEPNVPPEPPAQSAPKADWVNHAVASGATEAEAEALTKADLVTRYGGAQTGG